MSQYKYVVEYIGTAGDPCGGRGQSFDTRTEAVGWMTVQMRECPNSVYRLDVHDTDDGRRIVKGVYRQHPFNVQTTAQTAHDLLKGHGVLADADTRDSTDYVTEQIWDAVQADADTYGLTTQPIPEEYNER